MEDDVAGWMSSPKYSTMYLHTGPSEKARMGRFSVCSSMFPLAVVEAGDEVLGLAEDGRARGLVMAMLISSVMRLEAPLQDGDQDRCRSC